MLFLGIDQHARQLTVSLRNEDGDVILARQVSTQPEKLSDFFQRLTRDRLRSDDEFVAVLEVCGFNDWLIRMLEDYRCHKVILIQPEETQKRKTDRRDAAALSELLWVNRGRLLAGKPVRGLRVVDISSPVDRENRRLTTLRKEARQARTRVINKIKQILRQHNLQWHMPTKTFPTRAAIDWLKKLVLPTIDRLEMDLLLALTGGIRIRYICVCHFEAEPLTIAWAVPREGMCWEQSRFEKNDRNFPQRRHHDAHFKTRLPTATTRIDNHVP